MSREPDWQIRVKQHKAGIMIFSTSRRKPVCEETARTHRILSTLPVVYVDQARREPPGLVADNFQAGLFCRKDFRGTANSECTPLIFAAPIPASQEFKVAANREGLPGRQHLPKYTKAFAIPPTTSITDCVPDRPYSELSDKHEQPLR